MRLSQIFMPAKRVRKKWNPTKTFSSKMLPGRLYMAYSVKKLSGLEIEIKTSSTAVPYVPTAQN